MTEQITINGNLVQLKFGNYALKKYTELTGMDIGAIKELTDDYTDLDLACDVIFSGLFGNAKYKGEVLAMSYEDLKKEMDEVTILDRMKALKAFTESLIVSSNQMLEALKALQGNGEKKK